MDNKSTRTALAGGGVAAVLATACCVGPLVLLSLGLGGAWMSNLRALQPYQPIFIGAALVALFVARRRIFRPLAACKPGEVCAEPANRLIYKIIFWLVAAIVLVAAVFPYLAPRFY